RLHGVRRMPRGPVSPVGVVLRGDPRPTPGRAFVVPPTGGDCRDLLWPSLYRRLRATPTDRGRAAGGAGAVAGRPSVARGRTGGCPMPDFGVHRRGGWQRGGATATAVGGH